MESVRTIYQLGLQLNIKFLIITPTAVLSFRCQYVRLGLVLWLFGLHCVTAQPPAPIL